MIEVSLSLIERDVTTISPKIRLHWDMRESRYVSIVCLSNANFIITQLIPILGSLVGVIHWNRLFNTNPMNVHFIGFGSILIK